MPLLFVECKNIHRNLKTAFEQNFADYQDTIPHLFHHNAVVMFGNGEQAKIGSLTSQWEHFHEWKRLAEGEPGAVAMASLLKGVCDERNFLDLVESFILFDDSAGEPRKILARNHQFLGVNLAVAAPPPPRGSMQLPHRHRPRVAPPTLRRAARGTAPHPRRPNRLHRPRVRRDTPSTSTGTMR